MAAAPTRRLLISRSSLQGEPNQVIDDSIKYIKITLYICDCNVKGGQKDKSREKKRQL